MPRPRQVYFLPWNLQKEQQQCFTRYFVKVCRKILKSQLSILQWFQSLFFSKSKLKDGEVKKTYGIGSPQPLVKFALTSGSYSDPMVKSLQISSHVIKLSWNHSKKLMGLKHMVSTYLVKLQKFRAWHVKFISFLILNVQVRVYTAKTVVQELEMAKQEYLQTSCKIVSERKIFLPKIVESYAKELGLCSADVFQMIAQSSSYYILQKCIKPLQQNELSKNVEWIPHNFNFRYLFESELARWI